MKTRPSDTAVAVARVRSALLLVVEPGMVVELRILNVVDNPKYPAFTVSGYFDYSHLDALAKAAIEYTSKAEGCYVTINAVNPDLLARAANRVIKKPKHTTTDDDIARRVGLVFDADPKRPAGVSATDPEKSLARERIDHLAEHLTQRGWPAPILIDSGNGYHARYKIDLPNNDESLALIKSVLKAASAMFSNDRVTIDTSLSNAARIVKLPGTMARKGDDIPARPHRLSEAITAPDYQVVPVACLEEFAAEHAAVNPEAAVINGETRDTWIMTVSSGASPEARARAYVFSSRFPDSIAGQNGHDRLYHVASVLVDGFGLAHAEALPILREWNQAKAKPPESDKQVVHKIESAIKKHPAPSLKLLNATRAESSARPVTRGTTADEGDDTTIVAPEWPALPHPAAYQGLPGKIVCAIEPETEADPVALLVQLLVAFGSLIGRSAHVAVGAAWHFTNEFTVLVGETSAARKGSSWSEIKRFVGTIDPDWHIQGGLSSGEGLIYHVRDPIVKQEAIKTAGKVAGYQEVIDDHGVADKRLLVVETEFGGVLKVLARDGNKLSAVIRQAWDGGTLATMTKSFPYRATAAHVGIVGHITADELTKLLTQCDQANGFANRILWVCCKRSKLLPFGGQVSQLDLDDLLPKLSEAVAFAKNVTAVCWSREAMDLWEREYPRLTSPRPGVLGMVTSRAEAHTLRLALLYALMEKSVTIELTHLKAALALWDYCERSAAFIFGNRLADKDAEKILDALKAVPDGLTRSEIRRQVFSDHKPAALVNAKLSLLLQMRLTRSESIPTGGAPAERWFAVVQDSTAVRGSVKSVKIPPSTTPCHATHAFHAHLDAESVAADREVFEL